DGAEEHAVSTTDKASKAKLQASELRIDIGYSFMLTCKWLSCPSQWVTPAIAESLNKTDLKLTSARMIANSAPVRSRLYSGLKIVTGSFLPSTRRGRMSAFRPLRCVLWGNISAPLAKLISPMPSGTPGYCAANLPAIRSRAAMVAEVPNWRSMLA